MGNNTEYEVKILEIDKKDVIVRLQKLGAKKISQHHYRRHVFETIPAIKGKWVRLRSDNKHCTLAVKQILSDKIDGTLEWETVVDDFETTFQILTNLGLKSKGFQENKRTKYSLLDCEVCIDTWPKIPEYLEIEADSKEKVLECVKALGFNKNQITSINTEQIYLNYGIDISKEANLIF